MRRPRRQKRFDPDRGRPAAEQLVGGTGMSALGASAANGLGILKNPLPVSPPSAILHSSLFPQNGKRSLHDFRADAFVRENFQQQTVGQAAVDEVHALHTFLKRTNRAANFRAHAFVDHAALL